MRSRRHEIHMKLVKILNHNLNGVTYDSNIHNNVDSRLVFYDEQTEHPWVGVSIGSETREIEGGLALSRLGVSIRIYTKDESTNRRDSLSKFLEDITIILEKQLNLGLSFVIDTQINSIITDEGALSPLSVAEMNIVVIYDALTGLCK